MQEATLVLKAGYAVIRQADGTETRVRSLTEGYGRAYDMGLRITSITREV